MPTEGKCWRHCIIGTHGSWLPGSPKGWRSRHHKIHSSGDYKRPPPEGEHAGLHAYSRMKCPDAVAIPPELRAVIGSVFRDELICNQHQLLALAVGRTHCHCLAELPSDKRQTQRIIGQAKRVSSRAVKSQLPGRVWASGGKFILIEDQAYQRRVFDYIRRHADEEAWVWTFRDVS